MSEVAERSDAGNEPTERAATAAERKCHPDAERFPLLTAAEFDKLVSDIKEHGLREPGWLDRDGRILDGRNRDAACRQLGIEMRWKTYEGEPGTELAFILSLNLHRRHLSEDQRAAIAADLANLEQGDNRFTVDRPTGQSISQAEAAKAMKVSPRRARRAAAVKKHDPKLLDEVKAGKKKLSAATKEIAAKNGKKPKAATPTTKSTPTQSAPETNLNAKRAAHEVIVKFTTAITNLAALIGDVEETAEDATLADLRRVLEARTQADKHLAGLCTTIRKVCPKAAR